MDKDRSKYKMDDRMAELLWDQSIPDPDEMGTPPGGKSKEPSIDNIRFDIKPAELIDYLNEYIVGQQEAINIIATKICTHFHRMQLEKDHPELPRILGHVKSNMLLIGPTGVGKTYLIKLIADKLHVPFVKGDATKFSETGYVGGDVEDLVRELVHQSGGDIPLAEYGIIYIDEIDKIASSGSIHGPDVSRSGVQRNLLKLMEETEVDMKVAHDLASQMEAVIETQRTGKASRKKVNTRNILFIMSGAFLELPPIISKRLKKGGIGFTGESMASRADVEFLLDHLNSEDLMIFGFESEFVGRIPIISTLGELDEVGLYKILKNPKSAVIQGKKRDFAAYGIKLSFDDDALHIMAKRAVEYKTGARGLVSVAEKILLPFERGLPSTTVKYLVVNKDLCNNPEAYLEKIVKDDAFESYENHFREKTGIKLQFSPSARKSAEDLAIEQKLSLRDFLKNALKNYDYGLKLAEKDTFSVTSKVLTNPQEYLDKLVKASYQKNQGK